MILSLRRILIFFYHHHPWVHGCTYPCSHMNATHIVCVCTCMCALTWVHTCDWIHLHICMCVWRPENNLKCCSSRGNVYLIFWDRVSQWPRTCDHLTSQRNLPIFTSPELSNMCYLTWIVEIELRPSGLYMTLQALYRLSQIPAPIISGEQSRKLLIYLCC